MFWRSALGIVISFPALAHAHGESHAEANALLPHQIEGALTAPANLTPSVPGFGVWRLPLAERDLGAGFSLSMADLSIREHELSATTALGFDFGTLHHRSRFQLGLLRIDIDAALTASMIHSTHSRLPHLRDVSSMPRFCGTQNEISLGVDLTLAPLALSLFAARQFDPFHFGTGQTCVGDPPVWLEGTLAGAQLSVALTDRLSVHASLRYDRHRLRWDLDPEGFGTRSVEATTFFVALRRAL